MPRMIDSNSKKWIVDFSYYVYSGSYAFTIDCKCNKDPECIKCNGKGKYPLQTAKGVMTGGLYLVFQQIIDKLKDGWDILIAFDPPRSQLERTKLLDTYKGQRGEKPEGITRQMELGLDMLRLVPNVECYSSDNAESDDIMAALAVMYASFGCEVVVASRDKDMFPLLDVPNISIYKDGGYFTRDMFINKFNFTPNRFNEYLALCGDAADNFNLLKGIGPKAAEYIITNTNHILEVYDKHIFDNLPAKYKKHLIVTDNNGNMIGTKRDTLALSLQLATLDYNAKYYPVSIEPNINVFKNKAEQLELKHVLRNLNILFGEI
jgi:DNA polymerase-1